jgi:hypothetical protein
MKLDCVFRAAIRPAISTVDICGELKEIEEAIGNVKHLIDECRQPNADVRAFIRTVI